MHEDWDKMIHYYKNKNQSIFYDVMEIGKKHVFPLKLKYMFSNENAEHDVIQFYFEAKEENNLFLIEVYIHKFTRLMDSDAFIIESDTSGVKGFSYLESVSGMNKSDKIIIEQLKIQVQHVLSEMPEYRLIFLLIN